jgi:thiosulfate/3-mercaptopyruvate sulfurtransferase
MKRSKVLLTILILLISLPMVSFARDVAPVVNVAWLESNLNNPRLVVLDVRKIEDYKAGHLPGAVSSFFGGWAVTKGGLTAEVPEIDDLVDQITGAGISQNSIVVVVETEGGPRFHFAARVAETLVYAGLDHVAVLDGGHAAWEKAGKTVATDIVRKPAGKFTAKVRKEYRAELDYVLSTIGKITYLDARAYDTYFGMKKLPIIAQFGHIPGAISIPKEWLYDAEGLLIPQSKIEEILKANGLSSSQEIVTYCDTGMGCAAWWWVIHEMLGWPKIKSYDGSTEELSKQAGIKFNMYTWK